MPAPSPDTPRRRFRRRIVAGVLAAVLATAGLVAYVALREPTTAERVAEILAKVCGPRPANWFDDMVGLLLGEFRLRISFGLAGPYKRDSGDAERAIDALAALGPDAVPALAAALKASDEDLDVRCVAAAALGLIGTDAAAGSLAEVLTASPSSPLWSCGYDADESMVRQACVAALDAARGRRAAGTLVQVLADEDDEVLKKAILVLGHWSAEEAVPRIVALLVNHTDEFIRSNAAMALADFDDPRAVEPLIAALADESGHVRQDAADALGLKCDPRAVEPLIAALADPEAKVREAAVTALAAFADPRAFEPILAMMRSGDAETKPTAGLAAACLGGLGDPRAVAPLLEALTKSDDADLRGGAANAFQWMGDAPACDALCAALRDADADVRDSAARALGALGDARAVEPLLAALDDPAVGVRRQAADALGRLLDRRAVEPLIRALSPEHDDVRCAAAEALTFLGDARAADALAVAAYDPSPFVRHAAFLGLGVLGREEDVPHLLRVITRQGREVQELPTRDIFADMDGDENVAAAVLALALMRRPECVPDAAILACDRDGWCALDAVTALGLVGTPEARAALAEAAREARSPAVRRVAAAAIEGSVTDALAAELSRTRGSHAAAASAANLLAYVVAAEARTGRAAGGHGGPASSASREAVLRALDAAAVPPSPYDVRCAARLAARRIRALAPPPASEPRP
jgi:HEAT repeat protein